MESNLDIAALLRPQGLYGAYKRLKAKSSLRRLVESHLQNDSLSPQERNELHTLCNQSHLRYSERRLLIWLLAASSSATDSEPTVYALAIGLTQYSLFTHWVRLLMEAYLWSFPMCFLMAWYCHISESISLPLARELLVWGRYSSDIPIYWFYRNPEEWFDAPYTDIRPWFVLLQFISFPAFPFAFCVVCCRNYLRRHKLREMVKEAFGKA